MNGIIAIYVWDYAGKMKFLRYFWNAVVKINPGAKKYDEGRKFPICNIDALQALFSSCGIKNIQTAEIDIETKFTNFEDYWKPFLGGQGPAGDYVQSLDNKEKNELRDEIKRSLPLSLDGSINLIARAFAIRGTK